MFLKNVFGTQRHIFGMHEFSIFSTFFRNVPYGCKSEYTKKCRIILRIFLRAKFPRILYILVQKDWQNLFFTDFGSKSRKNVFVPKMCAWCALHIKMMIMKKFYLVDADIFSFVEILCDTPICPHEGGVKPVSFTPPCFSWIKSKISHFRFSRKKVSEIHFCLQNPKQNSRSAKSL